MTVCWAASEAEAQRTALKIWPNAALGGELKPSLDLVICVPVETGQRREVGPPVLVPPTVGIGGSDGWPTRELKSQQTSR